MRTHDLDALVLGQRTANVRAFTGEAQLWLAGTRRFTPAAVVVGATAVGVRPADDVEPGDLIAAVARGHRACRARRASASTA